MNAKIIDPALDYIIWRYLDSNRLQSLLETSSLYFSSADCLGDPYEGSVSQAEFEDRQSRYSAAVDSATEDWNRSFLPTRTMVSCWHCAEHESKAMWDLYAGKGICIQSTFQKLIEQCSAGKEEIVYQSGRGELVRCVAGVDELFIGKVWYYDPQDCSVQDTRVGDEYRRKYTRKPNWFAYEQEVRALFFYRGDDMYPANPVSAPILSGLPLEVLSQTPSQRALSANRNSAQYHANLQRARKFRGVFLPVNLERLLDRIVLAPLSPHRFKKNIERLVMSWGFSIKVDYSAIDVLPRF